MSARVRLLVATMLLVGPSGIAGGPGVLAPRTAEAAGSPGAGGPAATATPSALIGAVRSGAADQVRTLLAAKPDVNLPQADGATALHWAAHRDDLVTADLLLRAGAKVDAANDLGATPLWLAAVNGSERMVRRLLDAGADPNRALDSGETPLMAAARAGSAGAIRALTARAAAVNAREQRRGQTALMWAADQQHPEAVRALLDAGADLHARSAVWRQLENTAGNTNDRGDFEMAHGGSTALLFSARRGDLESARLLLDAGANANDATAAGESALVIATHSGQGALARLLLSRGADPNAAAAGYSALHAAVLRGDADTVRALLDHHADVNALVTHGSPVRRLSADYSIRWQMIGVNALWIAARLGHPDIVRTLLSHGATVTPLPADKTSALKAAMGFVTGVTENREGRYGAPMLDHIQEERLTLDIVTQLVEHGADVNAGNLPGDTPLHDAARQRFTRVIEFLVAKGAEVNARNKRNQTPLAAVRSDLREAPPESPFFDRQATIDLLLKVGGTE